MNQPKILPERPTDFSTNWISGCLHCIKLGRFLRTSHVPKPEADINVHKNAPKTLINQFPCKILETIHAKEKLEVSWTVHVEPP